MARYNFRILIETIKGRGEATQAYTEICWLPAIINLKDKALIFFYKGLAIISLINNTTESSVSSHFSLRRLLWLRKILRCGSTGSCTTRV